MAQERRKFYRWPLSIHCVCRSEEGTFTGEISNLSFGGARVVRATTIPPEGTDIEIVLHRKDYSVSFRCHVYYVEQSEDAAFGIEFYGTLEERTQKLLPLMRSSVETGEDSVH
jgi:hypothetical protein